MYIDGGARFGVVSASLEQAALATSAEKLIPLQDAKLPQTSKS
jgi:hypothetical protein